MAEDSGYPDLLTLWVQRSKAGDVQAFGQLIHLYQNEVFRMVYFRLHSKMDAEDVTQEVFLQAFRKLAQLREPHHFRTWLLRITVNQTRDFLRKRRLLSWVGIGSREPNEEPLEQHQDHGPDGMEVLLRKEFWELLKRLVGALSRWEREVFLLRYLDHMPIKDIAAVLNKSDSTIKTHLYRALTKVKNDPVFLSICEGA